MFARMMVKPKKSRKQRGSYFNFFFHGFSFSKRKGELYLLGVLCVAYVFKHLIAQ
jgi:hypothetical protein